jgi:hypothetical protein
MQTIIVMKWAFRAFLRPVDAPINKKQKSGIANSLGIDVQDEIENTVESQQMAANIEFFKLHPICRATRNTESPAKKRKDEIERRRATTGSEQTRLNGQSIQPTGKKASDPPENVNRGSFVDILLSW